MGNVTKEGVIRLLSDYPDMLRKRDILKYEMEHPALLSDEEMLESMSYLRGDGSGIHSGGVSDRTYYIAMVYREKAEALNKDSRNDIARRLLPLEREIERLEFYLAHLTEQEREAVRNCFFKGMSVRDAANAMGVSLWTLRKLRGGAVEQLVKMYLVAENGD